MHGSTYYVPNMKKRLVMRIITIFKSVGTKNSLMKIIVQFSVVLLVLCSISNLVIDQTISRYAALEEF